MQMGKDKTIAEFNINTIFGFIVPMIILYFICLGYNNNKKLSTILISKLNNS